MPIHANKKFVKFRQTARANNFFFYIDNKYIYIINFQKRILLEKNKILLHQL